VFIFLLPPSEDELRRRLVARDTEEPEAVDLRVKNAVAELADGAAYDHRVVNDDVARAAAEILEIVRSRRAQAPR
jgi:guanylate kinase